MSVCIEGANVVSSGCDQGRRTIYIHEGRFSEHKNEISKVIDGTGLTLTPGLIDMQIYGFCGKEFIDEKSSLIEAGKRLPEFGITAFVPTVGSQAKEKYASIYSLEIADKKGAEPLGWHLEGPFLNEGRRGVHESSRCLRFVDKKFWKNIFSSKKILLMTLAPELAAAKELIPILRETGVRIAVGHTQATLKDINEGLTNAPFFVTHLFNAMPAMHHRNLGIIAAVLGGEEIPYTIIADGIHVSSEVLRICYKCNPQGLALISDASSFLGGETCEGCFLGSFVSMREGKLVTPSGTLAGSTIALDEIVRRFINATGCPFSFAIRAASEQPAKLLGLEGTKGCIANRYDGDVVLWNEEKQVQATIGKGELLYAAPEFLQKRVKFR
jgi:N-acetylglucosamine-6-phosphate deacetylase